MNITVLCALVGVLAITFYVLLDGFDLGVGALLLLTRDAEQRDLMVESIAPTWDGNETWLIMAGVLLLGAFPIAYGILLPALYLPLLFMLWSLGFRGVSMEFRFQSWGKWKLRWDRAFCFGSVSAATMQGIVLGALIQGISVEGRSFSGTGMEFLTPFSLLCGVTILTGYVVLGSAWLVWKTENHVAMFARLWLKRALLLFAALVMASALASQRVQPKIAQAFAQHSAIITLAMATFILCWFTCWSAMNHRREWLSLAAGVGMFASGLAGLGPLFWPWIVPFSVTIYDAASPTDSKLFLLAGVVVLMPVVIGYSIFSYWVFRGKTRTLEN